MDGIVRRLWLTLLVVASAAAWQGCLGCDGSPAADADTDGDTDSDTDSDSDAVH